MYSQATDAQEPSQRVLQQGKDGPAAFPHVHENVTIREGAPVTGISFKRLHIQGENKLKPVFTKTS